MIAIAGFFSSIGEKIYDNFIYKGRWIYLTEGLKTTMLILIVAFVIGIVLGFIIAVIRATHDLDNKWGLANGICQLYLTVIRGTPVVVQLMIIYYVIFRVVFWPKFLIGGIAFGLNSAAYVAEIFRSGIMSIDKGQMEAGRSLGFNYSQTIIKIIMPQAFKNVLPALGNEIITLFKETSVAGYIGMQDLTKGGDIIRSQTYDAFYPLIAVAIVYLVIVIIMTRLLGLLERRLRKSDH